MATRRRRRRAEPKLGKEAWQIVGPSGEVLKELPYGEGPAVAWAISYALKNCGEGAELIVRLKPLLGPPDDFYRVVREKRAAQTYRLL